MTSRKIIPNITTPNQPSFIFEVPTDNFVGFDIFLEDNEPITSRFQKASRKISKSSSEESVKKSPRKKHNKPRNPWTPEEDLQLIELMKKHGQCWALLSAAMVGRSGKQIRDRYLNKLCPNIKKCGDWTVDEDEQMMKLMKELGNRWSVIATHLPGRTEAQVKNHYYSSIKKKLESNTTDVSQSDPSRTFSESVSVAAIPENEETKFDFASEFDVNVMNDCDGFIDEPVLIHQISNFLVSKGADMFEEEVSEYYTGPNDNSPTQRIYNPKAFSYFL